jgi:DNA invertase Pin-like site-specific DNA recombinase
MNCLVYSRVSTDEQAEKGRSIEDQVKICEKFAKDNDYKVVGVHKDPGKSATNMNRPALQDLLIRCQEDKFIDAVLVLDTDRLARNPNDHLQIKALLKKNKVQLISVNQPMVSGDDPESNLIDLIIAGINAFQSQITGRKVSKTMEQKILEGWWPGQAPIGYKNENIDGKNVISIDAEKAPYIKKAFEMYATGIISIENIIAELNSKGFRTRYNKPVAKSVLANIFKNPFYSGLILYKEKIYSGSHQAIISKELFDSCQKIIAERNLFATRERKHKYLLRGVVFCGKCGKRLDWGDKE